MSQKTEANAEVLLRILLRHFYVNLFGRIREWKYIEGVTLSEKEGSKFETDLLPFFGLQMLLKILQPPNFD